MLINLRNALMAGKRTPTAKDYVQDGLVAMWDGIENAGWGVHDASATTWVNLASPGNGDFTINSNGSWGEKWFNFSGISASGNAKFSPTTIEAVVRIDSGIIISYDVQHPSTPQGGTGAGGVVNLIYRSNTGVAVCGLVNDAYTDCAAQSLNWQYGTDTYLANILDHANRRVPGPAYFNGVQSSATTKSSWQKDNTFYIGGRTSGTNPYLGYGRIYCLRYHSRALTAAEIAHNYAVDKARFNLPDAT